MWILPNEILFQKEFALSVTKRWISLFFECKMVFKQVQNYYAKWHLSYFHTKYTIFNKTFLFIKFCQEIIIYLFTFKVPKKGFSEATAKNIVQNGLSQMFTQSRPHWMDNSQMILVMNLHVEFSIFVPPSRTLTPSVEWLMVGLRPAAGFLTEGRSCRVPTFCWLMPFLPASRPDGR